MFKFFSRKQSPVWGVTITGKEGIAAWSKFNKTEATKVFARVDTVFSCVDLIASGCSQVKFKAVETMRDGTKNESFDHPAIALLNNPAPKMSLSELAYSYAAWKIITGDSYLFLNTGFNRLDDYRTPPTEINVLPAKNMQIVGGKYGVQQYDYCVNGGKKILPVDPVSQQSNVMHSKFFNPTDEFYGLSPMQAAARNIDVFESALKWNKSLLDNSCRPSGMFFWKGEGTATEEQRKQIRKMIDDNKGPDRAGECLIGGGPIDFKALSLSPKDVEFLALRNMTMKDIARVYKISPILLNIGSDATFSNMAEARIALWDDAVIPLLKCWVNELNSALMPRYDDRYKLELDLTEVTALEPRRESQWKRAKESDFLTINEKRNLVGMDDVDDGDEILVPATQVPLSFATSDFGTTPDGDGNAAKAAYIDYITEKKKPLT